MRTLTCLLLALAPTRGTYAEDGARRILQLVHEHPGLPVGEIQKRLQLSSGTVYYHLERLEAAGEIETRTAGRRRLVFPATTTPRDAQAQGILRGATSRHIAQHILQNPGVSTADLLAHTGETPRALYYHLKQLREARLITSTSPTRYRDLRPTEKLRAMLANEK